MKAGELNRRVQILDRGAEQRSGSGQVTFEYAPSTTIQSSTGDGKVWADVRPVAGQKYFAADAVNSKVTHTILVRYQPGFRSTQRVKHEIEPGLFQEFDVESVLQLRMDRTQTVLMCILRESAGFR